MHFVACKTVREYNRNQEKIKQFLLTEKKQAKQSQQKHQLERPERTYNTSGLQYPSQPGPSHQFDIPGPSKTKPQQHERKQNQIKRPQQSISDFERKSKEAAIAQSNSIKPKNANANYLNPQGSNWTQPNSKQINRSRS